MPGRVNWRQAIAEVSLLFLGAALALSVDAWTDRRTQLATEREHLLALRADFEANDSIYREGLRAHQDQLAHIRAFLKLLDGPPESVPVDSLTGMVRRAFVWDDFVPVLATYHDLVGSGALSVLRSDSLRIALAGFDSYVIGKLPLNDLALDQWSSQVTPFFIQHLHVSEMYGERGTFEFEGQLNPGYDLGPPISRFQADSESVWSREFANLLAIRALSIGDAINFAGPAIESISNILGLIDDGLATD